ncbi:MAG TPA: response regulator, partial [Thermoanaerobaculia bacterium]|nr:response regulator [Thermoanaerobaculia bacterium]
LSAGTVTAWVTQPRLPHGRVPALLAASRQGHSEESVASILEFRIEAERDARERAVRDREEAERRATEEVLRERARLETERRRLEQELAERLDFEREEAIRAAEEKLRRQLDSERETMRRQIEQRLAADRDALVRDAEERAAAAQAAIVPKPAAGAAVPSPAGNRQTPADPVTPPAPMLEYVAPPPSPVPVVPPAPVSVPPEAARPESPQSGTEPLPEIPRAANPPMRPAAPKPATPRAAAPPALPERRPPTAGARRPAAPKSTLLDTVASWFRPRAQPRAINVTSKRANGNGAAKARPATAPAKTPPPAAKAQAPKAQPARSEPRHPRLILLERRRGVAENAAPKLRQRGIDVQIVERWVDAVDELFRFRPDAMLLDVEHPDFEKAYATIVEKSSKLPIILTGRSSSVPPPTDRYAAFVARPYDVDELARLGQQAMTRAEDLLSLQLVARAVPSARSAPRPIPIPPRPDLPLAKPVVVADYPAARPQPVVSAPQPERSRNDAGTYEVACYNCRASFNAVDADWCSCLARERTLVCTNCLDCFCKAPPSYKERFWVEAPARLFERKSAEARRQYGMLSPNPDVRELRRPLVLCVEDDEEIQAIVQRVCTNIGYGFVFAANGQDGLEAAQHYRPNLILSDAFMPKLDGREMCRMLKEDPAFAETRMIVMTGLYTDTKYRTEALRRFHVDEYIAKPVAVTDLINLLQRHLEGVTEALPPVDLHEAHRKSVMGEDDEVPLAELLEGNDAVPPPPVIAPRSDQYRVTCFHCQAAFEATTAEWCGCVGRDNTLVCDRCGGCFCKAPAAYKERFWIDAPPSLFERKMIGSKRSLGARDNPSPAEVRRPLILLVEDDENVQLIVRTVVTNLGYGFVVGANGQEGLALAREYTPDLILSDAFMPKLDGREMCRLLKEDPATARCKAIVMTGLYTDRKYRNEALDYFKVDDYVAKPLAVDDLIRLFRKHLPQEVAAVR